jgi:hypothetical protein
VYAVSFHTSLAAYAATTAPSRATATWEKAGEVSDGGYRYIVYKHKTDVRETVLEKYLKVAHNPAVADTECRYQISSSTTHELTIDGTLKVSGEVGFIASGTASIAVSIGVAWTWTSSVGLIYGETLSTLDSAGIYQIILYTKIRQYAIDRYAPHYVTKTRTYEVQEGKKTVTKTETYQVQEGWTYIGTETQFFFEKDVHTGLVCYNEARLVKLQSLPTIVG